MGIKRKETIVARRIHGSCFLIDISDNYAGDTCALYEINETGMFLWERMDGRRTAEELARLLQEAIVGEVGEQVLREDVTEFIETLEAKQFVEVGSHG